MAVSEREAGYIVDAVASELSETRGPITQARHMPGYIYTSPEIFRLEKEHIFTRDWLCVARVEEIERPGDYLTLRILGEPLILTRDDEGNVNASCSRGRFAPRSSRLGPLHRMLPRCRLRRVPASASPAALASAPPPPPPAACFARLPAARSASPATHAPRRLRLASLAGPDTSSLPLDIVPSSRLSQCSLTPDAADCASR